MPRVKGKKYPHPKGCKCVFHSPRAIKHKPDCQCQWHRKGTGFKPKRFEDILKTLARAAKAGRRSGLSRLRVKGIEEKVWKNECSLCGLGPEWNGNQLGFQVDHIDGDWKNFSRENLRLLCPNCHSQTTNFCRPRKFRD